MEFNKIIQLSEKEKVKMPLLITQVTQGITTAGSPYLSLVLQDKSSTIEGKLWDVKSEQLDLAKPGTIVVVIGEVLKYRNNLQLRIHGIEPSEQLYNISDFVTESVVPVDELRKSVNEALDSIENPIIKSVTTACFLRYQEDFFQYPAASKNHHDFLGGLATHVVAMLEINDFICKKYPLLNRDLLVGAILLHDMGKVFELSGPILTEYTMPGKLLGHISMMTSIVHEVAVSLQCQDSEEVILLKHMILSHHGEYEYGSPVLPMTAEAEILNLIDNLDARMNMFEKLYNTLEPQTFSQRVFSLENRSFYRFKDSE